MTKQQLLAACKKLAPGFKIERADGIVRASYTRNGKQLELSMHDDAAAKKFGVDVERKVLEGCLESMRSRAA